MDYQQGALGVDPSVAVALTLMEAEILQMEASMALAAGTCQDSLVIRDLSPLGRSPVLAK